SRPLGRRRRPQRSERRRRAGTLAGMVDWYTQVEMGSDVIRISEPHVNELLSANFWWLRGHDRDIVIDAGLGVVALREAIPGVFERDPMVLLTHAHLDHVG